MRSDRDLARLVDERLPLTSVESLSHHGMSTEEIYSFIVPRRGEDAKAARWLRKAKIRFDGRSPLEMLRTEAGVRLVEDMLLQLDYGFVA